MSLIPNTPAIVTFTAAENTTLILGHKTVVINPPMPETSDNLADTNLVIDPDPNEPSNSYDINDAKFRGWVTNALNWGWRHSVYKPDDGGSVSSSSWVAFSKSLVSAGSRRVPVISPLAAGPTRNSFAYGGTNVVTAVRDYDNDKIYLVLNCDRVAGNYSAKNPKRDDGTPIPRLLLATANISISTGEPTTITVLGYLSSLASNRTSIEDLGGVSGSTENTAIRNYITNYGGFPASILVVRNGNVFYSNLGVMKTKPGKVVMYFTPVSSTSDAVNSGDYVGRLKPIAASFDERELDIASIGGRFKDAANTKQKQLLAYSEHGDFELYCFGFNNASNVFTNTAMVAVRVKNASRYGYTPNDGTSYWVNWDNANFGSKVSPVLILAKTTLQYYGNYVPRLATQQGFVDGTIIHYTFPHQVPKRAAISLVPTEGGAPIIQYVSSDGFVRYVDINGNNQFYEYATTGNNTPYVLVPEPLAANPNAAARRFTAVTTRRDTVDVTPPAVQEAVDGRVILTSPGKRSISVSFNASDIPSYFFLDSGFTSRTVPRFKAEYQGTVYTVDSLVVIDEDNICEMTLTF